MFSFTKIRSLFSQTNTQATNPRRRGKPRAALESLE
jgi:hypothetical protein